LSALELVAAGGLAALVVLSALSSWWSVDPARSLLVSQRVAVYPLALLATLLLVRRQAAGTLLGGVSAACAVVSLLALGSEVAPGVFGGADANLTRAQLSWPVGYWNGLAALMAIGVVVAAGIAWRARITWLRMAMAAAVVPELVVMALTESRGAPLAMVAGLVVMVLVGGTRPPTAALVVGGVILVTLLPAGAQAAAGGTHGDFSLTGRGGLWRIGLDEFADHPALGGGAGSWRWYWDLHRNNDNSIGNPNNLYVETLAELGVAGLAALVTALAAPLVAAWRARGSAEAAIGGGAFAALALHAFVDFDWELPAVVLAGLMCASAALLAARSGSSRRFMVPRGPALAAALVLAVAAAGLFAGNREISAAGRAVALGHEAAALSHADRAAGLVPWSPVPDTWEGEALLARGQKAAAAKAFRDALAKPQGDRQWRLWFNLSRASSGPARLAALRRTVALNPRSGEVKQVCKTASDPQILAFCREWRDTRRSSRTVQ